jgi:glycosyltransferase involved in cell wall biosynthesis
MYRICLDARLLFCGGIGTYLKNLLWHFRSSASQFQLIVLNEASLSLNWLGEFELIPFKSQHFSLREQLDFFRWIPECDLFWSPHINVPLFPIRARKRLVTVHDVYYLAHFNTLSWFEKRMVTAFFSKVISHSSSIISVSEFSKKELQTYTSVHPSKIKVIYHGADHLPCPQRCDSKEKFILYVGNLKAHKNLNRLLHAFQLLKEKGFQDLHLKVIGKKDGLRRIDPLKQCSQVDFLEKVSNEELSEYYYQAEALILPSIYEGFGLTAIEAMAAGCPTIVSNAASIPEICGDASYYFDPLNEKSIAEAIESVLLNKHLKESLKEKGKQRCKRFSWKSSAESHLKLFEELIL